ncbi:MAG: hypothetical protein Q9198_008978 [Flavoplaca austrocitrina]
MSSSTSFSAFLAIESTPEIADPPAAIKKDSFTRQPAPNVHELDELTFGSRYNGPSEPPTPSGTRACRQRTARGSHADPQKSAHE